MTDFKCPKCEKVVYSEDALQQHMAAKHSEQQKPERKAREFKTSYLVAIVVIALIAAGAYVAMSYTPLTYKIRMTDNTKVLGNPNATVTLTEYSDFECPFCARFATDTEPQIVTNYVDTGKVKIVYKEFPLPIHENAEKAAEAAECALDIGGQDSFWKLHDLMFQNNDLLTISNLKKFAGEIGLNATQFSACLDSGATRGLVQADISEGTQLGIQGTPYFLVNGEAISGAQPYDVFKTAIDSKLGA